MNFSVLIFITGFAPYAFGRDVSLKDGDSKEWKAGDVIDGVCEITKASENTTDKYISFTCKDGTKVTVEANFKPKAKVRK